MMCAETEHVGSSPSSAHVRSLWTSLVGVMNVSEGGSALGAAPAGNVRALLASLNAAGLRTAVERYVILLCCREIEHLHVPKFREELMAINAGIGKRDGAGSGARNNNNFDATDSRRLEHGLADLSAAFDRQHIWIQCLCDSVARHEHSSWLKKVHSDEVTALLLRCMPDALPKLLREHYICMIHDLIDSEAQMPNGDDAHNCFEEKQPELMMDKSSAETYSQQQAELKDSIESQMAMDYSFDNETMKSQDKNHDSQYSGTQVNASKTCRISKHLRHLGLGCVGDEACSSALFQALDDYVTKISTESFDTAALPEAKKWLLHGAQKLLHYVLPQHDTRLKSYWSSRLEYHLLEALGDLRTDQMFSIVVDYPDSKPALLDLRACIEGTGRTKQLVTSFCAAIRKRLLHPGATTQTILRVYVDVIRVMKELDNTGVLLETVGLPIQEYLRGRGDAIRCIVTMLIDGGDGYSSLLEDIGDGSNTTVEGNGDIDVETEEAFKLAMRWEPDPIDERAFNSIATTRSGDVVSMLVGIYGSKELFVNEYRTLLAEKLLARGADFDTSNEIHAMELLKLRFGEQSMHNCDVMIRDLSESKRVNTNVKHELPEEDNFITATIISYLFWPQLTGEELRLPKRISDLLEEFAKKYNKLKTPRKLNWSSHLGLVELDLTFDDDRTLTFFVPPPLAAFVMHFEDKKVWPVEELASYLGITLDVLRRRAAYWIGQGVLIEECQALPSSSGGEYITVTSLRAVETASEAAAASTANTRNMPLDEENTNNTNAVADTSDQDSQIYEGYIVGMLTNFSSLNIDRIHNMLKMFMPEYDRNERQLTSILKGMVASEKLTIDDDGTYRKATPG